MLYYTPIRLMIFHEYSLGSRKNARKFLPSVPHQATGGFALGHGRGDPSRLLLRLGVLAVVRLLPNFRGDSEGKSVEAAVEASDKTPP